MDNGTRLAALDLGSNSFRLEIGRYDLGHIQRLEYHKETVQQGMGLDASHCLTPAAMQRGWDCLDRFAEKIAGFKPEHVRAVATQTLREAHNREQFLERAQGILGFPIDVVSGKEEARLIYQGVAHLLSQSDERRLVIDIGGRSTELILGQQLNASVMQSYRLGSAAWSTKYFADGKLSASAFNYASVAAKAMLDEVTNLYPRGGWDVAYGSSGTVNAVSDILTAAHWPASEISLDGLNWLEDKLLKAQHIDKIKLLGLREDRRAVIAGGVVILRVLFDLLSLKTLRLAQGALRHGAMYDLVDRRLISNDLRTTSVLRMTAQFQVDTAQSQRVSKIAQHLFEQITPQLLQYDLALDASQLLKKLNWAAQLHEIGSLISHDDYHKHGAYVLDHADVAGFAVHELHRLSLLVLGHRGKLKKLNAALQDRTLMGLLICLRLAVLLCHARESIDASGVQLTLGGRQAQRFLLRYPASWEQALPQTMFLLAQECDAWGKTDWELSVAKNVS